VQNYSLLEGLHHLAAGFKSCIVESSDVATAELRQVCGGAGYLKNSGIGTFFADQASTGIYEGTTTILYKEAARYLLKQMKLIESGTAATGIVSYLNNAE